MSKFRFLPTNRRSAVRIYCDGACAIAGTRALHGGYAAILVYGPIERIARGHEYPAKNGGMEIQALIAGLDLLEESARIEFYSDAQYLVNGVNQWLKTWIEKGWPARIANQDKWKIVAGHMTRHTLHGNWVRGHSGDGRSNHQEYNVLCDQMAVEEAWKSWGEQKGVPYDQIPIEQTNPPGGPDRDRYTSGSSGSASALQSLGG